MRDINGSKPPLDVFRDFIPQHVFHRALLRFGKDVKRDPRLRGQRLHHTIHVVVSNIHFCPKKNPAETPIVSAF